MPFPIDNTSGQSSVEAAFAIPLLMTLVLLLLQPGIVLYDWIVMNGAAAEGCRLLATSSDAEASTNEDYIRRRLSAIPQTDIFHIHTQGCSYEIELIGDEASAEVAVGISNKIKPLPLLDIGMHLAGVLDSDGAIKLTVRKAMEAQPEWVITSAAGSTPSDWTQSWK